MAGLTWLHLSDWHQRTAGYEKQNPVRTKLLTDIEQRAHISSTLSRIDFIIFSGDLAFSGKEAEYLLAQNLLIDPILNLTHVGRDRLFLVPGNHDLDQSRIKYAPAQSQNPFTSEEEVQEFLSDQKLRDGLLEPFSAYTDFVKQYQNSETRAYASVHNLVVAGQNISVLCLNSALMCDRHKNEKKEADDKGYLIVGEKQIHDAFAQMSSESTRIAILHHPFEWLADFDQYRVESQLGRTCHFILRGDQHEPEAKSISGSGGDYIYIPAGASFQSRTTTDPRYANAYNFVHVDFDTQQVSIYMRYWDDYGDKWTADTRRHSQGYFTFHLPKKFEPHQAAPIEETEEETEEASSVVAPWPRCVLDPTVRCPQRDQEVAARKYNPLNVYVNIPYMADYAHLEIAIWLTLKAHGLIPVFTRTYVHNKVRACKINHLMWECKFGISDFSRHRMNIAFEDMAMRKEGLQVIPIDKSRPGFLEGLSDLNAIDPLTHDDNAEDLIDRLSEWIEQQWGVGPQVPVETLWPLYQRLYADYQRRPRPYRFITRFYKFWEDFEHSADLISGRI